jgi:hypothetical protein
MNKSSVFLTAFWAGLAAPTSLYATSAAYRPLINDLTFSDSFALVGIFLGESVVAAQNDGQPKPAGASSGQLSFQFVDS